MMDGFKVVIPLAFPLLRIRILSGYVRIIARVRQLLVYLFIYFNISCCAGLCCRAAVTTILCVCDV